MQASKSKKAHPGPTIPQTENSFPACTHPLGWFTRDQEKTNKQAKSRFFLSVYVCKQESKFCFSLLDNYQCHLFVGIEVFTPCGEN
jgi:hypothetical protein